MSAGLTVLCGLALAAEGLALPEGGDGSDMVWSGLLLPLFGANSQDGLGLGVGGEIFQRPRGQREGYRLKITGVLWATVDLGYTADWIRIDRRGATNWLGAGGFRGWTNHAYTGIGGEAAARTQDEAELGNAVYGPFAFVGFSRPIRPTWSWFAQASYKTYVVDAAPGGLLALERPYGVEGGTYVDVTAGVEHDSTDRWPMPYDGIRAEASGRLGISTARADRTAMLGGVNAEFIGWRALGRHLTVGARVLFDGTIGKRPFFETSVAGGRWRDEYGNQQAFSGYGRTRTRGDSAVAAMIEIRPYFFHIRHPFFDMEIHGSVFVEQGYLARRADWGPPLPTVGFAPQVLFQGAMQCRPFWAWGWRTVPGSDRRRPVSQFGISFVDPL